MVLSSADIFFQIQFVCCCLFFLRKSHSGISVECLAIMPVGPDLGPNCLQRLSADDTSK